MTIHAPTKDKGELRKKRKASHREYLSIKARLLRNDKRQKEFKASLGYLSPNKLARLAAKRDKLAPHQGQSAQRVRDSKRIESRSRLDNLNIPKNTRTLGKKGVATHPARVTEYLFVSRRRSTWC